MLIKSKIIKLFYSICLLLFIFPPHLQSMAAPYSPVLKFYSGYHDLGDFQDGLAPAKGDNGKLGYIGLDGRLVIDYLYDMQRTDWELDGDFIWSGSSASAEDDIVWSWTPIERMFDPRVSNQYLPSSNFGFDRGYAHVVKDGIGIYIDKAGNEYGNPFPDRYYFVAPFYNGRAVAQKEKDGLFGYIDENGSAITGFKYLCAGHFESGVAAAIEPVPYKNGSSRYIPDYLLPYVTNDLIDEVCPIRKKNIPEGMDILDVYLDTDGNVLSWDFHDREKLDNNFSAGIIIDTENISEGLILRNIKTENSEYPIFRYELPDGTLSFELDQSLNITWAKPFLPEKIAEVNYIHGNGEPGTGYIDNTGRLLSDDEVRTRFPNLFKNIVWLQLDENGNGLDTDIVSVDGELYMVRVAGRNRDNPDIVQLETMRSTFFLVDGERILYDCTEQMLEGLAGIYCGYWNYQDEGDGADAAINRIIADISGKDSFTLGINIYKTDVNSNIYYVDLRKSLREVERAGYIIVE